MNDEPKPISQLVAQGWEIVGSSSCVDNYSRVIHSVLFRRQRQHRVLILKSRLMGKGMTVEERGV